MRAPAAPALAEITPVPFVEFADAAARPALAAAYDRAVDASLDLDRFCCQHAFVTAAFAGLQPGRDARVHRVGDDGWLLFAERHAALFGDARPRRLWEPLEAMWGLDCPVVGPRPDALGRALASLIHEASAEGPPVILLCGLRRGSARVAALVAALAPFYRLVEGSETLRRVAALDGGVDGFLSRRSPRFRANLRRARRQALARGLRYERHVPVTAEEASRLYARAVALDDASWKGRAEAGLRATGLYPFYERMLPRLAAAGAMRMGFVVDGSEDVAYLFGGVRQDTFRGLQFAFRAGREAESPGNLIQLLEVERLCDEGVARYDLGTEADYKQSWGELEDRTMSIIAVPRRGVR